MERSDLLEANGGIFKPQGEAINAGAADDVKVLVVGNPANTNCLIAMRNAPDVPRERFTAMMRLDHNRAIAQLAKKIGAAGRDITRMTVWGNHSADPVPGHLQRPGRAAAWRPVGDEALDRARSSSPPSASAVPRSSRPAGASSAESAASAAIDHVHDWVLGTPGGRLGLDGDPLGWLLRGRGGHHLGLPVHVLRTASRSIVEGLEIDDFSRERIDASVDELRGERDTVKNLGLV